MLERPRPGLCTDFFGSNVTVLSVGTRVAVAYPGISNRSVEGAKAQEKNPHETFRHLCFLLNQFCNIIYAKINGVDVRGI